MTEPTTPKAVVYTDDVVSVPTRSAFKSTAIYGLIVMLISAAVAKWVKPELREAGHAAAVELLDYLIPWLFSAGAAAVAWGRAKAGQPLHLIGQTRTDVTIKSLAPLLLALTLAAGAAGCTTNTGAPMSMASRVLLAKQTHTAAKNTAANLIDAGLIKDQTVKDAIWYASEEVRKGLEEADARLMAGDKIGFNDVMKRVADALDTVARINAKYATNPEPQTRGDPWTPSRLQRSFSPASLNWPSSRKLTTAPPRASSRPMPTVARWTPQRPRHALA